MGDPTTPAPTPLSPAAQAVLDAWVAAKRTQTCAAGCYGPLAAALRAAADQVKPTKQNYYEASHTYEQTCLNGMAYVANELCAIAAELEGAPND